MSNTARALKKYTWADYRTWPDDERWEVIGGEAYAMSPSPTARHQIIQTKLGRRLDQFFDGKSCRTIVSPMDVRLSDTDIVQPDVLVVCRPEQIRATHIEGAPALVVEILSESSAVRDRTVKMRTYARHGVAEVWLVTPEPPLVEVFQLDGATYRLAGAYGCGERLMSPGFPKLLLRLKDVFDFPPELDAKEPMAVREGRPAYGGRRARKRKMNAER